MSSKIWWVLAVSLTVVSGLYGLNVSRAEDQAAPDSFGRGGFLGADLRAAQADSRPALTIEGLVVKLREAKNDDVKVQAKLELEVAITKYFDEDMKQHTEEMSQLEERIKKLRSLLDRRADKKQEIIELQLKVIENEADGMGFNGMPLPTMGMGGYPSPLRMSGLSP